MHGDRAHGSPLGYVAIWLVLLGLTALTFALHKAPLGAWHVPVALTIATAKSALVVAFFMHLKDHSPVNRAFFLLSLVFVALLITGVVTDALTRLPSTNPDFLPLEELERDYR